VTWPTPRPGLVIQYSYLWKREANAGREEGAKDRPCAIVLAIDTSSDGPTVIALPITHSRPSDQEDGVETPPETKVRLGLDPERSWIIITEANVFLWPGPDLRLLPGQGPETSTYGMLPPALFRIVRDRFLLRAKTRRAKVTKRTE
jgi:hypothetical protein